MVKVHDVVTERKTVWVVVVDGKAYGPFYVELEAAQWALQEFPVASAQGRAAVYPMEEV